MNRFRELNFAYNQALNYSFNKMNLTKKKPWRTIARLTSSCNLKCMHCNVWKLKKCNTELDVNEWKGVIADIRNWLGCYCLTLTGGEPLLKKNMTTELIRFASEKGILTNLNINGWFLKEDLIEQLEISGLDSINISLDGFRAETHDCIRGKKGLHKRIFSAIKTMGENGIGIKTTVCTIIMEPNLDEILDLIKWTRYNGIYVFFSALNDNFGNTDYNPSWYKESELWPGENRNVLEIIDKIISMKQRGYPVTNSVKQLNAFKSYYRNPMKACNAFTCNAEQNFNIFPNGDVRYCAKTKPIGNLKVNDAKKIWYSKESELAKNNFRECNDFCKILNCNFDDLKNTAINHLCHL